MTRSEAIRKAIDIIVYLEAHFAKSQKAKKDAEDIIEALEQINEEEPVNKLTQQAYEDGKKDGYLQAKVDRALNTGWIPVSEDLPKDAYGCIVTVLDIDLRTQNEFENILPYFVGYDGETWNNAGGEPIPYEVIAWMKAPEPYKAEGSKE